MRCKLIDIKPLVPHPKRWKCKVWKFLIEIHFLGKEFFYKDYKKPEKNILMWTSFKFLHSTPGYIIVPDQIVAKFEIANLLIFSHFFLRWQTLTTLLKYTFSQTMFQVGGKLSKRPYFWVKIELFYYFEIIWNRIWQCNKWNLVTYWLE